MTAIVPSAIATRAPVILYQELSLIESEDEKVQQEAALVEKEREELEAQLNEYYKGCNECVVEDIFVCEKKHSLNQHLKAEMEELAKLNRTNILNEAFHIWFDGHFGTINNFRLGKMPSEVCTLHSTRNGRLSSEAHRSMWSPLVAGARTTVFFQRNGALL